MGSALEAGQRTYVRKFAADFPVEMTRSVREAIRSWTTGPEWKSGDLV